MPRIAVSCTDNHSHDCMGPVSSTNEDFQLSYSNDAGIFVTITNSDKKLSYCRRFHEYCVKLRHKKTSNFTDPNLIQKQPTPVWQPCPGENASQSETAARTHVSHRRERFACPRIRKRVQPFSLAPRAP